MPVEDSLISLEVVKGLMEVQERAFRTMIEMMFNGLKEDVKEIRRDVSDLRSRLEFSQVSISSIEAKLEAVNTQIATQAKSVEAYGSNVGGLEDQMEYLENQSRRNNIRIIGVAEQENETWEKSEELVKGLVKEKLGVTEELEIERAHRVGKKRGHNETRPDGSSFGPRPIVAKFMSWKQREMVVTSARQKRPKGISFFPDLSKRTLQRRADQIPLMIQARKEGKDAYFILDKLIIKEKPPQRYKYVNVGNTSTAADDDEETEITFN